MEEPATKKKKTSTSMMPDWSQLPEELLHMISKNLEENCCFDVIHARSVCRSWRSSFPFPSSLCSVKVKIPGSDPILMNMLDFHILSLSFKYRMVGWEHEDYRGVAFLRLNKEVRNGEFVVLLLACSSNVLMVLTSAEMRWKQLKNVPGKAYRYQSVFAGSYSPDAVTASELHKLNGSIWR